MAFSSSISERVCVPVCVPVLLSNGLNGGSRLCDPSNGLVFTCLPPQAAQFGPLD